MSILNNSSIVKNMFRKVEFLVWDLASGKLGIRSNDGILTLETTPGEGNAAATHAVSLNLFDNFGMAIPAYAVKTPNSEIEIGDIIVGSNKVLGWVVKKNAASLEILKQDGQRTTYTPVKTQIFGKDGYMVVKSLTGLLGTSGANDLNSNLMPLLMLSGDSDLDLDSILPLLLMQSQGQAQGQAGFNFGNALPLLLMTKGGSGGSGDKLKDMLPLLMMSGGMGGNGGGLGAMLPMMLMMGGLGDSKNSNEVKPALGGVPYNGGVPPLTRRR